MVLGKENWKWWMFLHFLICYHFAQSVSRNSHRALFFDLSGNESWTEIHQCNRFQFGFIYRGLIETPENFHTNIDFQNEKHTVLVLELRKPSKELQLHYQLQNRLNSY